MNQLRRNQWRDEAIARRHRRLARATYNLGILSFLLGLVAVLIPTPGQWTWPRIVAVVIAALAVAVETILVIERPDALRRVLAPSHEDASREQQRVQEQQPPTLSEHALRKLLFDEDARQRQDDDAVSSNKEVTALLKEVTALLAGLSGQVGDLQAQMAKGSDDEHKPSASPGNNKTVDVEERPRPLPNEQQDARPLDDPATARVHGDSGQVDPAGAEFDEEQHAQPSQPDDVDGKGIAR